MATEKQNAERMWVRVGPNVWAQLSQVPAEVVEQMMAELETLADLLPLTPPADPSKAPPTRRGLLVQGFRANYEVDYRRQVLTLLSVGR